jgi:hypothetical protein
MVEGHRDLHQALPEFLLRDRRFPPHVFEHFMRLEELPRVEQPNAFQMVISIQILMIAQVPLIQLFIDQPTAALPFSINIHGYKYKVQKTKPVFPTCFGISFARPDETLSVLDVGDCCNPVASKALITRNLI